MRVNSDRVAARVSELLDGAYASSRRGVGRPHVSGSDVAGSDEVGSDEVGSDEVGFDEVGFDVAGSDVAVFDEVGFDEAHPDDAIGDPDDGEVGPELVDDDVALRSTVDRPSLLARIAARVPMRVDPGRRSAAAVGIAVLVVAAVVGGWLYLSGPRSMAVPTQNSSIPGAASPIGTEAARSGGSVPPAASGSSPAPPSSSEVVVDVAGKVARPGLYHLRSGARIADAISAAGGARPGVDLTDINLAARVTDGQQILVGVPGAAGAPVPAVSPGSGAGGAGAGGSGSAGAIVDINTATLEQLETLPGIGPALAQRILDYRSEHGTFTSIDQLNDVSGIGDAKFGALKAQVTV